MKANIKVKMVNCREAKTYKDKIWTTQSESWEMCGSEVILLVGKSGGFAVDCLEEVDDESSND